jgi:hypothetical protein
VIARAEGAEVVVNHEVLATDILLKPLQRLDEAEREYRAVEGDLSTVELQPYREALMAAEQDVADLFTERLSIGEAMRKHAALGRAILQARIMRGDYSYDDSDDIDAL